MRRKINRLAREIQVDMHKVFELICVVAVLLQSVRQVDVS